MQICEGFIFTYMSRSSGTVVACYNKKGKLIKVYESAKKAAESRHLFSRTIDRCIRGDLFTVKGLVWKRYPEGQVPQTIEPLETSASTLSIKPVAKVDQNGVILAAYPSIRNAAINNKIDPHSLRDRLNQKYSHVGKTKFRYLTDQEIIKYNFKNGLEIDNKKKAVIQLSKDGKYIKSYPSIRSALISLKKNPNNQGISRCLKGEYDTAFGYRWRYRN